MVEAKLTVDIPAVCARCHGCGKLNLEEEATKAGMETQAYACQVLRDRTGIALQPDMFGAALTGSFECPGCNGSGFDPVTVCDKPSVLFKLLLLACTDYLSLLKEAADSLEAAASQSESRDLRWKSKQLRLFLKSFSIATLALRTYGAA